MCGMKITEALVAEHVVFHNIFDHIEKSAPNLKTLGEVKALAALLEALLGNHSKDEEDWIFAPLDHYLEQIGQRHTFVDEHDEIDASLVRVRSAEQVAQARRLLLQAVLTSRKHFDHEERIVFPLAEKYLKKETLQDLGKAWRRQRKAPIG
jgi:hemerythrin-like domain-containing protein